MPSKAKEREIPSAEAKFKANYGSHAWRIKPCGNHAEIEAYVVTTGKWETVLTVPHVTGCSTDALAQYILNLVNQTIEGESLMLSAMKTMQAFLVENDFHPKVEEPVTGLIERIQKTYGVK